MFSMFQHGLHQPSWLWAAPRLLASAVYLGRFLGKFSSWSWQTTLHWWLWGDKIWMIWMSGWKGYLSLWKKKGFSEDDNKQYLRAWSCMGWMWKLNEDFFTAFVCWWQQACAGAESTQCEPGTSHAVIFNVSAWWQGWVDQSWLYFLLLWARDDSLIGMFHMPRKNKESTRGIYFDTL